MSRAPSRRLGRRVALALVICPASAAWAAQVAPLAGQIEHRQGESPADHPAFAPLRALAERQRLDPDPPERVSPPEGVRPRELRPHREWAEFTLNDVLNALPPPPAPAEEASDEASREESVRRYVIGLVFIAEGKVDEGVAELLASVGLNPSAPEPRGELGQALLRIGRTREGVEHLQRAEALGLRDPAALLALWRGLQQRREWSSAARAAGTLLEVSTSLKDPVLRAIALANAGQSLLELGAYAAALSALEEGLAFPLERGADSIYRGELIDLTRRRAELWRVAGDVRVALHDPDGALRAYQMSEESPSFDPGSAVARQVWALAGAGRGADAALLLARALATEEEGVDPRRVALVRYLAGVDAEAGRLLGVALAELASGETTGGATRRAGLVRAAAAASPEAQRADLLLEHLRQFPHDPGVIDDVVREAGPDALMIAARALDAAPLLLEPLTERVIESAGGDARAASNLVALDSPARLALVASLQLSAGAWDAGRQTLLGLNAADDAADAVDLWRAQLAVRAGDWERARTAIDRLTLASSRSDAAAPLLATALLAAQRPDQAEEAFARWVTRAQSPAARAVALVASAELAQRRGDAHQARALLEQAREADPSAEVPQLRLIDMLGTSPQFDARELAPLVSRLRETNPSSRGLRLLRIRELARTSEGSRQALSDALRLTEDDPRDRNSGAMLFELTLALPANDPWAPRVRAAAVRMQAAAPDAIYPPLVISALNAVGGVDDPLAPAQALLDRWLDAEALRGWERLLVRDVPEAQASQRLLALLADAPASPDLAPLVAAGRIRAGDLTSASRLLREGLPPDVRLQPVQTAPLIQAIEARSAVLLAGVGSAVPEADRDAIIALLDEVEQRVGRLTASLHEARLEALTGRTPFDLDAVVAAGLSSASVATDPERVHRAVARRLERRGLTSQAVSYARRIAEAGAPSPTLDAVWLEAVISSRRVPDALDAVRTLTSPGRFEPLRDAALKGPASGEPVTPADLAYFVASSMAIPGRADSDALYELALELDPRHAPASNDLGYNLLERDERRDLAARLIEQAAAARPDDASFTDSLGWLRYKQGRFEDGADGSPGAVTLLRRATVLDGTWNPTLSDHLGDALWRAGRPQEAAGAWADAVERADRFIRRLREGGMAEGVGRYRAIAERAREKQLAVIRGERPQVAPTWGELDAQRSEPAGTTIPQPQPAPQPDDPNHEER